MGNYAKDSKTFYSSLCSLDSLFTQSLSMLSLLLLAVSLVILFCKRIKHISLSSNFDHSLSSCTCYIFCFFYSTGFSLFFSIPFLSFFLFLSVYSCLSCSLLYSLFQFLFLLASSGFFLSYIFIILSFSSLFYSFFLRS